MGCRFFLLTLVTCIPIALGCFGDSTAGVEGDSGLRGFSFSDPDAWGQPRSPTGQKPQSKLWFNDGYWWGSFYDRSTSQYHIHRYSRSARTWQDTDTLIDGREDSRADILWDGTHLYVASAPTSSASGSASARVLRFSYDPKSRTYALDGGFPATIAEGGMEAVVLAKDTTGKLWVTYTQNGKVYVNHSLDHDRAWGEPFVVPTPGATVSPDDISAVAAFGTKIGVMWSNQHDEAFYFATHSDGEPADAWESAVAIKRPNIADDHLSLKVGPDEKVYAAVKTSLDEAQKKDSDAPLILLLTRDRNGSWSSQVVSQVKDGQTRPIVQVDEENRSLYVFATVPCCEGGAIFYKKANLEDPSFPKGPGIPFVQSTTHAYIDDATSTKQNVNGGMGLMVLASDLNSGYYLHNSFEPKVLRDGGGS